MLTRRPLMFISLSFVAGMYILSLTDIVNVLTFTIVFAIILLALLIKRVNFKSTLLMLLCLVSFFAGSIRLDIKNNLKTHELYGVVDEIIECEAEVVETPQKTEKTISFIANVTSFSKDEMIEDISEKTRFLVYLDDETDTKPIENLSVGDVFTTKARIELPSSSMNYGGFDYSKYLKSQNIFFNADLNNSELTVTEHKNRPVFHTWINFREKCISFFDKSFPEAEGTVLKAFVAGDKSGITDDISNIFKSSGLAHVLAVSGLHVSVFISLFVGLLKLFNVSKRKEMLFASISTFAFVFFTGASVSALRAGIMAVFVFIAKLLFRKSDPKTTLSFAGAIFCLVSPNIIYSASFMLSFSATAGILIFYEPISVFFSRIYKNFEPNTFRYKFVKGVTDSTAVGLSAQILVIPILIYLFNEISTMSIISTLLITPFLSFLLAGGLLFIALSFISPVLAFPAGGFIFLLSKLMLFIADFFGGFSFSKILFGEITPFLILMYALVITIIISLIKKHKAGFVVSIVTVTLLSVIGIFNLYANYDTAEVSFINVGQGDCALFKAPGDCDILFDSGGYDNSTETGRYIIAPYLIKSGVTDIEYVIISHMHADHIIGLLDVLDILKVDNLIIPYGEIDTTIGNEVIKKAQDKNVTITYFTHGDVLKINDKISITAIAPDGEQSKFSNDENDLGIVARIDYGESSFLFTGDITSDIEKHLVRNYPESLDADVLKVAHHGSKHSSCEEFLEIVKPDYAYIPVGSNLYGHPTPEAIQRLEDVGADVYRADVHRDVTFYFDLSGIKSVKYYNE